MKTKWRPEGRRYYSQIQRGQGTPLEDTVVFGERFFTLLPQSNSAICVTSKEQSAHYASEYLSGSNISGYDEIRVSFVPWLVTVVITKA
jgi:hypothetical protein